MSVAVNNFTTGPATLADVGTFYYNGCTFSPLFETTVSGTVVRDNANRTVKYMEYVITADGYVTLPFQDLSTTKVMGNLRTMLTAQGGNLTYQGRGCDIQVNASGTQDVAWGPVPELLEFQPLGGGASAKVRWQVKFRISEMAAKKTAVGITKSGLTAIPLLQFNYETSVSYGEDGYSSMNIRGTIEIPLTRATQPTRTLTVTVDNVRSILDERIFNGIDLNLFRIVRREYSISRDKRTMEFNVEIEEKPYMDLPPSCTVARGSFNVRPSKSGVGLCSWLCTLRSTYTVRGDEGRRVAWFEFLYLLRLRMGYSQLANVGFTKKQNPGDRKGDRIPALAGGLVGKALWDFLLKKQNQELIKSKSAWLIDFSVDEGIYLDSKTTSFSATWRLTTTFSHILLASGLWRKTTENDPQGGSLWAANMKDMLGSTSWIINKLDPKLDIIVDFGGG